MASPFPVNAPRPGSPHGARLDAWARILFGVAVVVAGIFFLSLWGINAEGFDRHDMGIALALSFAFPLALYCSLGVAAASLLAALVSALRRRRVLSYVAPLAVSLLPATFLMLKDLFHF
jgi:hypothetical protein